MRYISGSIIIVIYLFFQADVNERKGQDVTKVLSVPIENCGISTIPTALLSNIWQQAAVILSHYHVLEVGDGYVVKGD
jgi:hypothetical protein